MTDRRDSRPSRRALLTAVPIVGASSVAGWQGEPANPRTELRHEVVYGDKNAVVPTTLGAVRGYTEGGIHTFKGIPYGSVTPEKGRFMPAERPAAWTATRDCLVYGPPCTQRIGAGAGGLQFFFEFNYGARRTEDCLTLNIWTPDLTGRQPVMVWLHGGGFTTGSSFEMPSYDGRNLAATGNVVVVSLNHRLNAFGYLDLSEYGSQFAASGNVGMLDIVDALQWVRDNISNFGGDARNVTVFGQSGGGAKVNFLLAMPSAKGLFHKAIAQSATPMVTDTRSRQFSLQHTAAVLKAFGLDRSSVEKLRPVPEEELAKAFISTYVELEKQEGREKAGIGPYADGHIVSEEPFRLRSPEHGRGVPMLVGNTLNEGSGSMFVPAREQWTQSEMRVELAQEYGTERANRLADALQKTYPHAKPVEIFGHAAPGANGLRYRIATMQHARLKAAQGGAPVYVYTFAWQTPVADGRPRAFHRSDIAFVFNNTDRCAHLTGGGEQARRVAASVSSAWTAFARTGSPNHDGLPVWPAFSNNRAPTMFLDARSEVRFDHDRAVRDLYTDFTRPRSG